MAAEQPASHWTLSLRGGGWAGTGAADTAHASAALGQGLEGTGCMVVGRAIPTGSRRPWHRPDLLLRVVPGVTGKTKVSAA